MKSLEDSPNGDTDGDLHDRATRGQTLSPEESRRLEKWYRLNDDTEAAYFTGASSPGDLDRLTAQVEAAAARLATATERVRELTAGNATLQDEVARLRERVRRLPLPRAA